VKRYRSQSSDHPPFAFAGYRSTAKRSPAFDRIVVPQTLSEITGPGPAYSSRVKDDADLTTNAGGTGAAIGQRSIVTGRVLDEDGRAVPNTAVEIWQADASGRYAHPREKDFPAPRDANFVGRGTCMTDANGVYRFTTIKPGPYPWGNHQNAWRPSHIHFSVLGPALITRLVTQMYFPDDPLLSLDPIFHAVPEPARPRLVASYDHSVSVENWALGYRFDIVLAGEDATPREHE
jgi:protocatechuate 3,4-dioxygenase beta subunit